MKRLENNVTVITGGGKGLGFGMATAFAREGSNLVITGRDEARLLKAKKTLEEKYGVTVVTVVADGADELSVKLVIATATGNRQPPALRQQLPTPEALNAARVGKTYWSMPMHFLGVNTKKSPPAEQEVINRKLVV